MHMHVRACMGGRERNGKGKEGKGITIVVFKMRPCVDEHHLMTF